MPFFPNDVDITEHDIQQIIHLGVSARFLAMLLEDIGVSLPVPVPPPKPIPPDAVPLTPKEIEVLKQSGARFEKSSDHQSKLKAYNTVRELVSDSRSLQAGSLCKREVASRLGILESDVIERATATPPRLYSFRDVNGSVLFPKWQFSNGCTIPHLTELLSRFPERECPLTVYSFMTKLNRDLEHNDRLYSPAEWLTSKLDPQQVMIFFVDGFS